MRWTHGDSSSPASFAATSLLALSGTAPAATGDNLRTITANQNGTDCADANRTGDATGAIGTGIAFDGTNLLLSCWSDNTVVEVSPPGRLAGDDPPDLWRIRAWCARLGQH